ncbi:MAG TPA: translation initiation factor IF-2 [Patescibacteria group bacterium]|nr:translation initiation factor IF-2 [Patescibacteria group bacterium]
MIKTKKEKTVTKKKTEVKAKVKTTKPAAAARVKKAKPVASAAAAKIKKPVTLKHKAAVKKESPALAVHPHPVAEQKAAVTAAPLESKPPVLAKEMPVLAPKQVIAPAPREIKKPEPVPALTPAAVPAAAPAGKEVEIELPIVLKDLAVRLQQKPSVIIKTLMGMGIMAGINQLLDESLVTAVCEKFACRIKKAPGEEELALRVHTETDTPEKLKPRSPIVTFMGHVDHGKTSLLDAIRQTKVAESEHGGITQHIGAYRVVLPKGEITFLDTPGHEAFTAMRARGASITDIVVLVVAADDGVMPQTSEAIDHARAAGVSIIVAINKIDKPQANIDRVKKQLAELDLTAEDWGGKTITVGVSAKTGAGIDDLLEMILLEAEILELKANPAKPAKGIVLEAKISKGRGPVATLLVRDGSLRLNQNIIVGSFYGKIRAMFDHRGHAVTEAPPSWPVEALGLSGVPQAGEQFFVIEDDKTAKDLALARQEKARQQQIKAVKRISLDDLHAQIKEGKLKELKLILKSDVQGSLGAIKDTLMKLDVTEVKMVFIHEGVGNINSSDVILAVASDALILGFHVEPDDLAKELIAKEGVDVRTYNIIYELANDIKAAVEGMLEPKLKKVFLGRVEIRKVFKTSRSGAVAGCFVSKGQVNRNAKVTILRNGEPVFEGSIASLKRFKDDVREVAEGFECGITIGGFEQIQEGDTIEAYEIEKIARKL